MNRTIKDATTKAFHYPGLDALKAHVFAFVSAYNFAKHLKALRRRTPFQAICDAWAKDPAIFKSTRTTSSRNQTPRLRTHCPSQKMTMAAIVMAPKKVVAQRS